MLTIENLNFPKHIGLEYKEEIVLTEELLVGEENSLNCWIIPAGVSIKVWQSENFGYILLPQGTKDNTGKEMHLRVFRY